MKELTVKAVLENISKVTEFIDGELEAIGCPVRAQIHIDVAVDELFGNIAHYAYTGDAGNATVRFNFDESTHLISVTFIDDGVPFNPLEHKEPNVTLPMEEREVGGLGIYLVRKTMDTVKYRRENNCNILTIEKKI